MSPYDRVARVLVVLALVLVGLLLAIPMSMLDEQRRLLTCAFAAGLFLAAVISCCLGFVSVPQTEEQTKE